MLLSLFFIAHSHFQVSPFLCALTFSNAYRSDNIINDSDIAYAVPPE